MKRSNSFLSIKVLLIGLVILIAGGMFAAGTIAIGGLIGSITGTSLAFAAAAGTTTSETSTTETIAAGSSELLDNTISKKITELKPSANPLDTILREIGEATPIKSWEYEYYYVDQKGITDTIKTAFSATNGSAPENTVHEIYINAPHIWNVDDNIMFVDVLNSADKPLVLHIVETTPSASRLTVLPLNGNGTNGFDLPALAQGKTIVRIGNAKAEMDVQTAPYQAYPQKTSNFCQIHMAQIEESIYAALHEKEVKWDLNDHRLQALYDLRRSMELTSLFGVKKKVYDPIGRDYKYMTGGITSYITKGLSYSEATLTANANKVFTGWGKSIFTGNSGSEKRVLFGGGTFMSDLMSIPTVQKQIEAKSTEVVWGITFKKIDTGFGELLVKYHPLFDEVGYIEKGLVLDVNYLEKAVLKPMSSADLKLIESGQKNAKAQNISETLQILTRYPDLHAIISKTT